MTTMPPATKLQIFAIDRKDPAVAIWEKGFSHEIVEILNHTKLSWTKCGLYRYGKDANTIDNSPPTVVVFAPGLIDSSKWSAVTKQIKDLMAKNKMAATFALLEGVIVDAVDAWQKPNPYNKPRALGESCGIHDGLVKNRPQTGTMGGSFLLKKAGEPKDKVVGLTNNHVVNEQPAGESWDKVTAHRVVIPSDSDHTESKPNLKWLTAARGMDQFVDINPEQENPNLVLSQLGSKLKDIQLPGDAPDNVKQAWTKYQAAWVPPNINPKNVQDAVNELWALNIPNSNPIKVDLGLMRRSLTVFGDHLKAWTEYDKADELSLRYAGRTFAASGLRASTGTQRPNVALDWAVVEEDGKDPSRAYSNRSEDLRAYAKKIWDLDQARKPNERVLTSCALGNTQPAMKVDRMDEPLLGSYVFKIGRSTGPTVGQINGARSKVNGKTCRKIGPGFPGKDSTTLEEVEIVATSKLPEQTDPHGFLLRFSDHGDSGSWILDCDGKLVGLLWGFDSNKFTTQFTPIQDVVDSIADVTGGWQASLLPDFPVLLERGKI